MITNTNKKRGAIHPEWLFGGNPNAIEQQEAEGQKELVDSSLLPVKVHGKEELEKLGVKFGQPLPDDPLFCEAELPEGWKKRPTDHSMGSELVDEKGKVRAFIFYKAAFYDRSASMLFKE